MGVTPVFQRGFGVLPGSGVMAPLRFVNFILIFYDSCLMEFIMFF